MAKKRPEIQKEGGDIAFVSVSPTAEKPRKFLELNPNVPEERIFVDSSKTFEAYKAVGFGKLTDADASTKPKMKPPGFSVKEWWKYITNVVALSIDPNEKVDRSSGRRLMLRRDVRVKRERYRVRVGRRVAWCASRPRRRGTSREERLVRVVKNNERGCARALRSSVRSSDARTRKLLFKTRVMKLLVSLS